MSAQGPSIPRRRHVEHHLRSTETVRDIVIGMSDGLTVPFALAAGLSGAISVARVVVVAGLAEIAAGAIAMGLGGYLAARTDAEHYVTERRNEGQEVEDHPDEEGEEIVEIFATYGVSPQAAAPVVGELLRQPAKMLDFLMRFELGLEEPDPRRAGRSAVTIAVSYIVGGLVPLSPYFFLPVHRALEVSIAVTLVALLIFGFVKGRATGAAPVRGAVQTAVVGGLAAAAAFGLARLISG